jgi:hypothetical protein
MVKARVKELHDVPHFIVVTELEGFLGESWTVQVEILERQLLGNLPADEDDVPPLDLNGNPPPFDFFGLGQPGLPPFNQQHNQHHNQGLDNHNVEDQEMENDLVDILDAAPAAEDAILLPDLNLGIENDLDNFEHAENLGQGLPDLNVQEVISVGSLSFGMSSQESPEQEDVDREGSTEVVLALEAEPVDFLHLELQPHELNAGELSGSDSGSGTGSINAQPSSGEASQDLGDVPLVPASPVLQNSTSNQHAGSSSQAVLPNVSSQFGALNVDQGPILDIAPVRAHAEPSDTNLQVRQILLPDSLEIDLGLFALQDGNFQNRLPNAEGVRLWAKQFAPISLSDGVTVPRCWSDFFTKALLNPGSFEWAKNFLESKAWTISLKDQPTDKGFSFSFSQKCPGQVPTICSSLIQESSSSSKDLQQNSPRKNQEGSKSVSTSPLKRKMC